jgi:hypothetical protein
MNAGRGVTELRVEVMDADHQGMNASRGMNAGQGMSADGRAHAR